MAFGTDCVLAIKFYWKTAFLIIYPCVLLPIILIEDNLINRCIYVIALMSGLWITEAVALPITALIPVVFFPLFGILNAKETTECYITESTMLFFGGYMLALAFEESNLHLRISLRMISLIGFSPKRLHVGFCFVTMLISMWISNTATTALMLPILHATLRELETHNIGKIFEGDEPVKDEEEDDEASVEEDKRIPTTYAMGYYISIAYASAIGGTGYITGSAANIQFKGIYEETFPNLKINSGLWLVLGIPFMLITMSLTILWMQILYMGLFRPNSTAAQAFKTNPDQESIASAYITEKLESLGWITFHEIAVAICFLLAILLWITREAYVFPGWSSLWSQYGTVVKDATVAMMLVVVLFLVPRKPDCCYIFSSNEEKKPTGFSRGLLKWKFVLKRFPWGLIFLIGAGFAIAEGAHKSGLSERITQDLEVLGMYSPFGIMSLSALLAAALTQLLVNVGACGIIIPTLATIAKAADVHPMYITMPACIATSFGYLLPVATPPNAIIAEFINMSTLEMIKAGIGVWIISYLVLLGIFGGFLPLIVEVNKFPLEAYMPLDVGS